MRLLAAEHPDIDGNKRTALAAIAGFYAFNGFELDSDDEVREILRGFATNAESVDMARVVEYLRSNTTER